MITTTILYRENQNDDSGNINTVEATFYERVL